jgi:hypothetical protein
MAAIDPQLWDGDRESPVPTEAELEFARALGELLPLHLGYNVQSDSDGQPWLAIAAEWFRYHWDEWLPQRDRFEEQGL